MTELVCPTCASMKYDINHVCTSCGDRVAAYAKLPQFYKIEPSDSLDGYDLFVVTPNRQIGPTAFLRNSDESLAALTDFAQRVGLIRLKEKIKLTEILATMKKGE